MKHTIEIEGLPEGWEAVDFRIASNENVIDCGEVIFVTGPTKFPCLVVKKKQPRRIVLEETDEDNILPYQAFPGITLYNKKKIWHIVEDSGEKNDD